MNAKDRRKRVRVEANNLISYESIDKDDKILFNSMGRAVNVSQSGILIETARHVEGEYVSIRTVDLTNNLIDVRGQVIYCRKVESGLFQSGIRFIGPEQETAVFVMKLIKLYQYRQHNMSVQITA